MLRLFKLQILLLLLFDPFTAIAQIKDDFTDGDFTALPQWLGDEAKFNVNNSLQLQLNPVALAPAYLTLPVNAATIKNKEWEFWVKLGFSPSSLNNARLYLTSDQPNLTAALNGYYLQLGEASSADKIELLRQNGLDAVSICRGKTAISKAFEIRIKVICDSAYRWIILTDSTGANNFLPDAIGIDSAYNTIKYTGMLCNYTASNAGKFYFDDVYIGDKRVDKQAPVIDSVVLSLPDKLIVYFNEAVDKTSAQALNNYSIDNNIGAPLSVVNNSGNNGLTLRFANKLQSGVLYKFTTQAVKDVAGNKMLPFISTLYYYMAQTQDVVINEVMPDPVSGCVDFVEIYNRSNKIVELNKLYLCAMDTVKQQLTDQKQITKANKLLLPGDYLVLTTNSAAVKQHYSIQDNTAFLDMPTIPAMNIEGDVVVLANTSQQIIDKLIYNSSMHFPLLTNTKGVSLERIDYNRPAEDKTNWHSAAEQAGFGTPGYKNSQYLLNEAGNEVTVMPEIFSPDNDGYNDVVTIGYNLTNPDIVGSISIYNTDGRLVKSLVHTQLLGTSGTFSWDGIMDNHEKARKGIYIFYMELFDTKGRTKQLKKTVVLAVK